MKIRLYNNLVIAALITALFFVVTHKVYHLPYSYGDDHRVLAMLHPEKASADYKAALYGNTPDWHGCFSIDYHIGRFRPLTWSYNKLLCMICGDNTYCYRISNLFILFLSAFFLLSIFTCFEVDRFSSFVVLAFYVFGRNNETWWTLIPPPQDVGECFLLAGMFLWLYYRKKGVAGLYIWPAFLFFLASISKESFIFCIPVILLTDYLFFNPNKKLLAKEYWLSILACFLPFMGLLITVLMVGKIYSYTYPESLWLILGYNLFQFIGGAGFFVAPILAWFFNKKSLHSKTVLKLTLLLIIWGIIQLVLLKGIKLDDQHHYLIPWLLYPLILTGIALAELRKLSPRWYRGSMFIYAMATLLFAKNTNSNVASYTAQLQAYYNMLDTIKKDTATPLVVYLGDNACLGDWINGTRIIMDNMGIKQKLYFATTAPNIPDWQKDYAAHSPQYAFKHISLDSVFYPDGRWIIFVENPAKNGVMDVDISLRNRDTMFYQYVKTDGHGTLSVDKNDKATLIEDTVKADSIIGGTYKGEICYMKINGKEQKVMGKCYYFSMPYPGHSIGDMLKGNNIDVSRKGFYAIRMKGNVREHSLLKCFDYTQAHPSLWQ